MRKPFNAELIAYWFSDSGICAWCLRYHANCGHHVVNDGLYSNSILNCSPLNNEECHLPIHSILKKRENVIKLLTYTFGFLMSSGYILTKLDKNFIESNKELYKEILKKRQ